MNLLIKALLKYAEQNPNKIVELIDLFINNQIERLKAAQRKQSQVNETNPK